MTRNDRSGEPTSQARLLELYDELDRLEELIEDLAALQVRSLEEAEARIVELDAEIEEIEGQAGDR
jgi:transposase